MKNMQYNPYLCLNCQNFRVSEEIGVEKHGGDIRFKTGSGNMAVSCMRNEQLQYNRYYSVIVDMAMGQITRSNKHISSYTIWKADHPSFPTRRIVCGDALMYSTFWAKLTPFIRKRRWLEWVVPQQGEQIQHLM